MTNIVDLGVEGRQIPTVDLLPDGWEKVDDGYYHKLKQDPDKLGGRPYCAWELHYRGYKVVLESGLTAKTHHTVEKDPFDRLWAGVKMAHMPRQFIEDEIL